MTKEKTQYKGTVSEMFLKYYTWIIIAITMLGSATISAQVTSQIDTTAIRIGEELTYTLSTVVDTAAVVVFPEGQQFLPMEVIESYKIDTLLENSKYRLIKKYGLTQFDSGRYYIPAQRVIVNDKLYNTKDTLQIQVIDVPVDTTKQKMFDIKQRTEVDSPPFQWGKLFYWIAIILIPLGLLIIFFATRKKIRAAKKEVVLPPYEEAVVALQELDSKPLLLQNNSKEYYSQLTEIVKRYLDREVDDTALESTTDELIARLQLHKKAGYFDFDNQAIKELETILKRADLVKFAKMSQSSGQAEADRGVIGSFIDETHEAIPEPTEEEKAQSEAYAEEMAKKRRKKNTIKGIVAALAIIIVALGLSIAIKGWDDVRDALIGNEMRELSEGRWYQSEYGSPSIIVETPEILTRLIVEIPEELRQAITSSENFEYRNNDIKSQFQIVINTTKFAEGAQADNDAVVNATIESNLAALEKGGALNMTVKQEEFETEGGITGVKAYGEFNQKAGEGKIYKDRVAYEMLLFQQQKGLQHILVVYIKDNFHAAEMKNRIIRSVELEVAQEQANKTEQK